MSRQCKACDGSGLIGYVHGICGRGRVTLESVKRCGACQGSGVVVESSGYRGKDGRLVLDAVADAITAAWYGIGSQAASWGRAVALDIHSPRWFGAAAPQAERAAHAAYSEVPGLRGEAVS